MAVEEGGGETREERREGGGTVHDDDSSVAAHVAEEGLVVRAGKDVAVVTAHETEFGGSAGSGRREIVPGVCGAGFWGGV